MTVQLYTAEDLKQLSDADIAAIYAREKWLTEALENDRQGKQIPPDGVWSQLIFKAGRGFGKTRAVVEWGWWEGWRTGKPLIGHAVAPTLGDVKGTLMRGASGFQAVVPAECMAGGSWEQAYVESPQPILTLANGTIIKGFGAQEQGGRLRGPQANFILGDELREWDRPAGNLEFVHSNMMFGCRLKYPDGSPARAVLATTPKNILYLKNLYKQKGVRVVTGSSYENLANLNEAFRDFLLSKEGTKIGRQEIHALDIDGDEDSILKDRWLRRWPSGKKLPEFAYVLMSMDTAFEEENMDRKGEKDPDFSACSVWGVFNLKQLFTADELKAMGCKGKYAAVLCDFWMERYSFPDLLEEARRTYRQKYGSPGKVPDLVLIENKASGISLRQTLQRYGVPTWPFNPRGQSKTMRAHAASPFVMQGCIFIPESRREDRKGKVADWAEPLCDQLTTYSGEGSIEYDDGLDTTTQAILHLYGMGMFAAEPQGRAHPDPDEQKDMDEQAAIRAAAKAKPKENPYGA